MKKYSQLDFKICRSIAIIITALYCFPFLTVFVDISGVSDTFMIPLGMFWLMWPILIMLSWGMCIERYLNLEFQDEEKKNNKQIRRQIYISVASMVLLGIIAYCNLYGLLNFVNEPWEYMEKLHLCILFKFGITFSWLLCWIYSIRKRTVICSWRKVKVGRLIANILIFILLIGVSVYGNGYVAEQTDDALFWKNVYENTRDYYYERYGE